MNRNEDGRLEMQAGQQHFVASNIWACRCLPTRLERSWRFCCCADGLLLHSFFFKKGGNAAPLNRCVLVSRPRGTHCPLAFYLLRAVRTCVHESVNWPPKEPRAHLRRCTPSPATRALHNLLACLPSPLLGQHHDFSTCSARVSGTSNLEICRSFLLGAA